MRAWAALITASTAAASAFAAPAVFDFETGTQGWVTPGVSVGIGNFQAAGGALQFDYVTPGDVFDPILNGPGNLGLDAEKYHWLRIDVEIETTGSVPDQLFQIFFDNGSGYNEPDSRTFTVPANAGVVSIVFDMAPVQSGRDPFTGTVSNFRIDPGISEAELVGGSARIHLIAMTDDTNFNFIPDDTELAIYGDLDTATRTTDSSGNGVPDWIEIAMGLNPLVDVVQLPVGGAAALLVGLALIGARYSRRRD